jgi:hypothetical protein
MRLFAILFPLLFAASAAQAEEPIKLKTTESSIPRPTAKPVEGPLPRPILLVRAAERGETFDEPSATSLYVFDHANSQAGFRKVFAGPGEQYCRFITPLLGGCGIAVGRLDAEKEAKGPRTMFWFDLLSGRVGKTIAQGTWMESLIDGEIVFLTSGSPEKETGRSYAHLNRYDFSKALLTHYQLGFTRFCPIGKLAYLVSENDQHIVKIDLAKNESQFLAEPPKGISDLSYDEATGVYPAGPDCREGIYYISNFSLFFKPPNEDWHTVIEKVNIVKTFGGRMPRLPVAYVGGGRFAVAKTTQDRVEVPENEKRNYDGTPAMTATMLLAGKTGKVIEQTEPQIYDNNPQLNIPETWWSQDMRPAPQQTEDTGEKNAYFKWIKAEKAIQYAGDKKSFWRKMKTCKDRATESICSSALNSAQVRPLPPNSPSASSTESRERSANTQ